jgi:hypothetical protein
VSSPSKRVMFSSMEVSRRYELVRAIRSACRERETERDRWRQSEREVSNVSRRREIERDNAMQCKARRRQGRTLSKV